MTIVSSSSPESGVTSCQQWHPSNVSSLGPVLRLLHKLSMLSLWPRLYRESFSKH